jgi:hypothetical protein
VTAPPVGAGAAGAVPPPPGLVVHAAVSRAAAPSPSRCLTESLLIEAPKGMDDGCGRRYGSKTFNIT